MKEYQLDIPCRGFCVSDDDSRIWAIATNTDYEIVDFDLNNQMNRNKIIIPT